MRRHFNPGCNIIAQENTELYKNSQVANRHKTNRSNKAKRRPTTHGISVKTHHQPTKMGDNEKRNSYALITEINKSQNRQNVRYNKKRMTLWIKFNAGCACSCMSMSFQLQTSWQFAKQYNDQSKAQRLIPVHSLKQYIG